MNLQDFNNAKEQRNFDVIPAGTIATLQMKIRPGGAGEGGCLRRSKAGDSEALDCEFAVLDGEFKGRKFWMRLTLEGTTNGHAGHAGRHGPSAVAAVERSSPTAMRWCSVPRRQGPERRCGCAPLIRLAPVS